MKRGRLALLTALVALTGCSAPQVYRSLQTWRQNECQKLPDAQDRVRCLDAARISYEDYRRETEGSR